MDHYCNKEDGGPGGDVTVALVLWENFTYLGRGNPVVEYWVGWIDGVD